MEFDKSKVFTVLNADDVKVSSKGYFEDTLEGLKDVVQHECSECYGEIKEIETESYGCRFCKKSSCGYSLFYLVEEPKENKFRPYKDIAELKQDFSGRYNSNTDWNGKVNPMYNPLIWVKSKRTGNQRLITVLNSDNNCVRLSSISVELRELFEDYVYLDGSPCGIEEQSMMIFGLWKIKTENL